jgi:hypothetical protein
VLEPVGELNTNGYANQPFSNKIERPEHALEKREVKERKP